MARITIQNLSDNQALDRQAMLAISGGNRTGSRPLLASQVAFSGTRIFDYPPGFVRTATGLKSKPIK